MAGPDRLTEREEEILERLARGHSDQQIADDLYLSLNTVKWYNRQIYSKLGVTSRTQAIAQARRPAPAEAPALASIQLRHGFPSPMTQFIGRRREITEVAHLLHTDRLVTLTGTGGTGKTRLALQVAADSAGRFSDGAYFVDLAPLSKPAQVTDAIAGALGVVENPASTLLETLKRALSEQQLLLVIDNFEHLLDAASLLADLLNAAPGITMLVTSRSPLHLSGEHEYPVPPLRLPAGALSARNLIESEAGALFLQRARMSLPHFEITDTNADAIAQICARLDGLPLAIELAAARCKLLPPQALLDRLERVTAASSLHLLASGARDVPPRQRTMRDSVEWSYNLLDPDEQILFARLAVFRGGWSLDAVEAVCTENLSLDLLDGLALLVDKSLVQQRESANGSPRFVLLETINEYAQEQLEASGSAETLRNQHAAYYVALAERAEPELRLARYDYWAEIFEIERDNIRAALEWSLSGGSVVDGVRLASALVLFWYGKGYHVEGIRWMQRFLDRLDEVPRHYHPKFLASAGHMAWFQDLDMAKGLLERALAISREMEDTERIAWSLAFLGYSMMEEPEAALPMVEESLTLFRALDFQPGIAQNLNILGEIYRTSGDDARARRAYEESLAISRQTGETRRICYICSNLAYIAQHEGDHKRAIRFSLDHLQLALERKNRLDITTALRVLAGSIGAEGDPQRAARLLGTTEIVLERLGSFHQPGDQHEHGRIVASVRNQLDDDAFNAAWEQGRNTSLEAAIAEVLSEYPD